jgi:hypothetical protein
MKKFGKLIVIWNPIQAELGASSLSISLGTILTKYDFKRTLLMNYSHDLDMERYIEGDVDVAYSLDDLKVLRSMTFDVLKMYVTSINDKLDILGGYKLPKDMVEGNKNYSLYCIEVALQKYDYVVVDISNRFRTKILDRADIIISLLPFDRFKLDKLTSSDVLPYVKKDNTICVFNKLPLGLEDELKILRNYNIKEYLYLPVDSNIHFYSVIKPRLYSYLVDNIRSRDPYIEQVKELNHLVQGKTDPDLYNLDESKSSKLSSILRKKTS